MDELKPCKQCKGGTEHLMITSVDDIVGILEGLYENGEKLVICTMCGAIGLHEDCLGWNSRPIEDLLADRVKTLEAIINFGINKKYENDISILTTQLAEKQARIDTLERQLEAVRKF